MRRARPALVGLLAGLLVLTAGPAGAQVVDPAAEVAPTPDDIPADPVPEPPDPSAMPKSEEPPLPLIEAVAQGYEQRPSDEVAGSLKASLLALGPGLVVHGLGHFSIDENRSGVVLLLTEVTAVLLLVGAGLIDGVTNESAGVAPLTDTMTQAGIVLFVASWVADVIGAFTGTVPFDPDSTRIDGSVFGLAYRYTDSPLDAFRHHLVGRLSIDLGWMYARPLVDLEAQLDARRVELDLGWRVLRGADPHEHLAVGVLGRRFENRPDGYAASGLLWYVWGKADLGHFMRTLRGLYIAGRVGYGADGYQFSSRVDSVPGWFSEVDFVDTRLILQSGLGFNTGEDTHILALWSQDTIGDIPPDSVVGQLHLALQHRYLDTIDIEVEGIFGDGFAVWLGLGYAL